MLYLHKCNILLSKIFIKPGCNFTFTVHTSEDTWICVTERSKVYACLVPIQVICRHTCMQINTLRKLSQLLYISRCYEAKIEESEKAGSCWESNPGHLASAASTLLLSHDDQTTTSPHNPLYVLLHR